MRKKVLKESSRRRIIPVAAWVVTGLLGSAITGNAMFGQPDTGRALALSADELPEGATRIDVDAPQSAGTTIRLRYDPIVEAVQRELAAAGYYKGLVDGVIGRKTKQAISAYQAAAGLEPDGKPTADLAEHIRFTREVSEASLFTGTIKADPQAEARATVRRVQTGLAELAYNPGAITGELTGQTRDAILAFQRDRKLPETGEVSEALVAELGKMSGQSELTREP